MGKCSNQRGWMGRLGGWNSGGEGGRDKNTEKNAMSGRQHYNLNTFKAHLRIGVPEL